MKIGFPFCVNVSCMGVFFVYTGRALRYVFDRYKVKDYSLITIALLAIIMFTIGYFANLENSSALSNERFHYVVMAGALWGDVLPFLISAISSSVGVILISIVLDNKIFHNCGKYTLFVLGVHGFTGGVAGMVASRIPLLDNYGLVINSVIFSALSLAIACSVIPIVKIYFPNLLGK